SWQISSGVAPSQKAWITLSMDTRVPAIRQVPCGVQTSKSGRSRLGFMEAILDHPFLEGNPLLCGRSNTQLGHFDVSGILEKWKFRQDRGRTLVGRNTHCCTNVYFV